RVHEPRDLVVVGQLPRHLATIESLTRLDENRRSVGVERVDELAVVALSPGAAEEPELVPHHATADRAADVPQTVQLLDAGHAPASQIVGDVGTLERTRRAVGQ